MLKMVLMQGQYGLYSDRTVMITIMPLPEGVMLPLPQSP